MLLREVSFVAQCGIRVLEQGRREYGEDFAVPLGLFTPLFENMDKVHEVIANGNER